MCQITKVKPVMAIAEVHANVTSPHGHGGFDFVYLKLNSKLTSKHKALWNNIESRGSFDYLIKSQSNDTRHSNGVPNYPIVVTRGHRKALMFVTGGLLGSP